MVEKLASLLNERGLLVDVFCKTNFQFCNNSGIRLNVCDRLVLWYLSRTRTSVVYKIIKRLLAKKLYQNLMARYNLIDFHAFSLDYIPMMEYCVGHKIPFDITPWGSDVMRASSDNLVLKSYGFDNCRIIKSTPNLLKTITEKYGEKYNAKSVPVLFGNSDYELIDSLTDTEVQRIRERILGDVQNKIIVTCGYNGIVHQNHKTMVDAINELPEELKLKICVVFPMTYGCDKMHVEEIRHYIEASSIPLYIILDEYMESKDVAALRLFSDVVVNIQKTDAFSGSLQDHLYCGNVLIVGNWLQYDILDENEVFYVKTSKEDLSQNIQNVLTNLTTYRNKCTENKKKMVNISSWKQVIDKWVQAYQ